jgi:hypothetical protein
MTGNGGTSNILNSMITGNHCTAGSGCVGGITVGGPVYFKNTIIALNDDANCYMDTGGSITSQGHNLDSDNTCNLIATGDLASTAITIGLLADNGGYTQTHAVGPPSRGPNDGDDSGCPSEDQRGVLRPQGTHCDIGAYEYTACTNQSAKIEGGGAYDFIGEAYVQASSGQTVQLQSYEFGEDLRLDADKEITLKGAYNCGFTDNLGVFSAVRGSLTIIAGKVTIEKLKMR